MLAIFQTLDGDYNDAEKTIEGILQSHNAISQKGDFSNSL